MARRSGLEKFLMASAREYSRQVRLSEQQARRSQRLAIAEEKRNQRERAAWERRQATNQRELEREVKQQYLSDREYEVDAKNTEIQERIIDLSSVLEATLDVNDAIDFDDLRITEVPTPALADDDIRIPIPQPNIERHIRNLKRPSKILLAFPWVRRKFELDLNMAKAAARLELEDWQRKEAARKQRMIDWEALEAQRIEDFERKKRIRNGEVDAFEADYKQGIPDALVSYFSMVLERSSYPGDFPQNFSIAYQESSRLLVVEYELPNVDVVPIIESCKYVRTKDRIDEKLRKRTDIKAIYSDLVASIILRTLHEIFESDTAWHVQTACINGCVHAVDPATGQDIKPYLVSVRVNRETFINIDLRRIDKAVCLKNLGAQVSRNPDEVQPVKPIVEFQMADVRFIDQQDIVSGLSNATNLMDLNPYEFEEVVANLFGKMGLESRLTRSSRDGGVDCIAFDPRPVLGGKVAIQAKRYKHTVGVSAVRDLYGTMLNEGASKGLLVTTSGYGPDAFAFAKDKPIELIDGGGLLYLLSEVGIEARIVMPSD